MDIGNYEGIVYSVRNKTELQRLGSIQDLNDKKLIVVTIPSFYQSVVDYYLNNTDTSKINGIVLVTSGQTAPASQSDDSKSPNNKFGLYSENNVWQRNKIDWNPAGQSYMFENFQIPIYIVTEEKAATDIFVNCYEKFNKQLFERGDAFKALATDLFCGMQLGMDMSGALSSKVCLRRQNIQHTIEPNQFCDPLGGSNYFTFLSQKPSNSLPVTIVSARVDTFTMYEYYTPAANEPISSIIGLLSLAELLARHRDELTNNILFVLFDNEAFEYGGSSRFVNDLNMDKFPSFSTGSISNTTDTFKLGKYIVDSICKRVTLV